MDIVHIQKKIENYLLSREDDNASNRQVFGMEAWGKFREYVQEIGDDWLDNRYARFYMEHRNIMVKRMRKLNEMGFFKVRQRILGTIQKANETEERIISRMLERMSVEC